MPLRFTAHSHAAVLLLTIFVGCNETDQSQLRRVQPPETVTSVVQDSSGTLSVVIIQHSGTVSVDASDSTLRKPVPVGHPLLRALDEQARPLTGDTIFVDYDGAADQDPFTGTALDVDFWPLFAWQYPEAVLADTNYPLLFITARIVLDSLRIGYILRVPGMYDSPSRLHLWTLDTHTRRFAGPLELADSWGDAGYWTHTASWFVDLGQDGALDLVTYREHGEVDIEVDSLPLLFRADSVFVRQWVDGRFGDVSYAPSLADRFKPTLWERE